MPSPREDESRDSFVDRCVPVVIDDMDLDAEDEDDRAQAVAVCNSMFEQAQNQLLFTVNQVANVRHQNVDGTEYLVAPVVLIREGVLNGELVKASEFTKHYQSWNDEPFVVDHPHDKEGNAVTASHPLTLAGQNPDVDGGLLVGRLYNTEPHEDALRSEIWIPIERVRQRGGAALDVLRRLQGKERLEVSTAYWRDLDLRSGEWQGHEYGGVALNLKPDHVAALPDGTGACSWADGCGAPRLNEEDCMETNVLSTARTPDYSGTNSGEWSRPALEDFGFEEGSVGDLSAEQRREVASISLLGDPDADTFSEMTFFPVVNPANRDLYENALDAVLSGRGAQADIPADALESARAKARSLLEKEFDRDLQEEEALNALQTIVKYARVIANKWGFGDPQVEDDIEEEGNMERDALIAELLENTDFSEEDLEGMTDCGLKALSELVQEPEAEPEPVEEPETNDPEPEYVTKGEYEDLFNKMVERMDALEAELHKDEAQRHNELVKSLAANDRCAFSEERLRAMETEDLEALKQSLVQPDYSGNGGGPQGAENLVPYRREVKNG